MAVVTLWWHVYGGRITAFDSEVWTLATFGESTTVPADAKHFNSESFGEPLEYLTSFDHAPTDAELEALTPEEFRDE